MQEEGNTFSINPLSTNSWKYDDAYFVMTGNNIHVEIFCSTYFLIAKHPIFKQKS